MDLVRGSSRFRVISTQVRPARDRMNHLARNAALHGQAAGRRHTYQQSQRGKDPVPGQLNWTLLGNHRIERECQRHGTKVR